MKMLRQTIALFLAASLAITATQASAQTAVKPDGTQAALQVDANSNLKVTSGTGAAAGEVQGNSAAGVADTGNPVKVGGVFSTSPTAVAAGQRTNTWTNPQGALMIAGLNGGAGSDGSAGNVVSTPMNDTGGGTGGTLLVQTRVFNGTNYDRQRGDTNGLVVQPALSSTFWSYPAASGGITNSTVGVTARAAAGAGVRNYIKSLQLTADALGAATEFVIRDGAAGTVLVRIKVNTGGIAGSGTTIFDPPLRGTANTLVEIQALTASVTGGLFANLQGYTGN